MSANSTPTYKLAKFLLPFLTPLNKNEYTAIDSFHFAEEICKQNSNLYMASQDVGSLFTNIPLDKTIGSLYNDNENIPEEVFRN